MQKGSVLIFLLLGVILLISAIFLVTQTKVLNFITKAAPQPIVQPLPTGVPDPTTDTSNWKTYTNTQYGYQFKYPNALLTLCEINGVSLMEGKEVNPKEQCTQGITPLLFGITHSLSGTGDVEKSKYPQCYSKIKEDFNFNGIKAVKYTTKVISEVVECSLYVASERNKVNVIVSKGDVLYNMYYDQQLYQSEVLQILSTFKFTN